MKVLHLINRPQMRGAEMFAVRVATRLEEGDVENAICSLYTSTGKNDYFSTGDLRTYELNVKASIFDRIFHVDPKVMLRLRKVLKDFQPDVVIGHGADTLKYTSLAGWLWRDALTIYKNIGTASYWANTRARVWFNRFWLRNIDCSVSVSEHTRQDFVSHYSFDSDKAIYIPNAIRIEDFDDASGPSVRDKTRSDLELAPNEIGIGMVGSLSAGKGQDSLIKATSLLIEKGHPIKLVLIGDGPEREKLVKQAADEGISDYVSLLGVRKDIPDLLSGMDIFALASLSEGMPGVLIEAGLSGLPSIAYDVGGVTEVLSDQTTGLVVPSGDFLGLVNGLEELTTKPDLRNRLGDYARSWCRSRFNLTTVADQYRQLFDQLLTGSQLTSINPAITSADNN